MSESFYSTEDCKHLDGFLSHVAEHSEGMEAGIKKPGDSAIRHLGDLMQSHNLYRRGYDIAHDDFEMIVDEQHKQMAYYWENGEANQAATKVRTIKGLSIIFPQYHKKKADKGWLTFEEQTPAITTQNERHLVEVGDLDDKTVIKLYLTALDTKDQFSDTKDHIAYIRANILAEELEAKYPGTITTLREVMSADHSLYE